jgi:hypothetical protein
VKRFDLSLLFAVTLLVACAPEPQSTNTMRQGLWDGYATLVDLVSASDLVVRVKVIDGRGYSLVPGAAKSQLNWYTDARMTVEKVLKGGAPNEIVVLQMGLAGEPGTMWPEMPVLTPVPDAVDRMRLDEFEAAITAAAR